MAVFIGLLGYGYCFGFSRIQFLLIVAGLCAVSK